MLQETEFYEKKLSEAIEREKSISEMDQARANLENARFVVNKFAMKVENSAFFAKKLQRCHVEQQKLKTGRKICLLTPW